MSYIIPGLLFVSLSAVAFVHALWAKGSFWPAQDELTLSAYVVGIPGQPRMPPRGAAAMVAAGLAFAALVGLTLGFHVSPLIDQLAAWAGAGLVAVFGLRGIAGYTRFWRALHSGEVFALLDKRFYSPFCVLVAEGFFLLVSERLGL